MSITILGPTGGGTITFWKIPDRVQLAWEYSLGRLETLSKSTLRDRPLAQILRRLFVSHRKAIDHLFPLFPLVSIVEILKAALDWCGC